MATVKIIDPVTRLEGHLKISVNIDMVNGVQQVIDAWATGTLFRGFEQILVGRDPNDAQHITQRVCGVCPVAHGLAAVNALDAAYKVTPPANARVMRNLVQGADFIQSHILQFYHLTLQDFIDGPNMPPWQPSWKVDKRLGAKDTARLVGSYVQALDMRRKASEMGAIFGGRLPHPPAFIAGGFTTTVRAERITLFRTYIKELVSFINNVYIPDVELVANSYKDYFKIGAGSRNLLAYGVFDLNAAGSSKLLKRGRILNGGTAVQTIDPTAITEQVTYSWYDSKTNNLSPASGSTKPQFPKAGAYSWLKAPRYTGGVYEVGPLARMWVNGDYQQGISVMDRHRARAAEAKKLSEAMVTWVDQLVVNQSAYTKPVPAANTSAYGLTEAARGALGHWVQIANGKIANYQIVTPTCWNASPRDSAGKRGAIEQALVGTPVADIVQPVEVVRVIHSFDPCLSCAVHVTRPDEGKAIYALGQPSADLNADAVEQICLA